MKKLAIVTAALALVAVMIALPAPTVWAQQGDVVIVKCSEVITTTDRGFLVSAAQPKVVVFQGSFGRTTLEPTVCGTDQPDNCAECIAEINRGDCSAEAAVLVNSRITELSGNNLRSFSIEKYVFACGGRN